LLACSTLETPADGKASGNAERPRRALATILC
jgi:hypothetical protein